MLGQCTAMRSVFILAGTGPRCEEPTSARQNPSEVRFITAIAGGSPVPAVPASRSRASSGLSAMRTLRSFAARAKRLTPGMASVKVTGRKQHLAPAVSHPPEHAVVVFFRRRGESAHCVRQPISVLPICRCVPSVHGCTDGRCVWQHDIVALDVFFPMGGQFFAQFGAF